MTGDAACCTPGHDHDHADGDHGHGHDHGDGECDHDHGDGDACGSVDERATSAPGRDGGTTLADEPTSTRRPEDAPDRMVRVPGGTFQMGTDSGVGFPEDGEGPTREVQVDPFYVDQHAVTNAEFLKFVQETGYTTESEEFGWSFVFEDCLTPAAEEHAMDTVDGAPWWHAVEGACWHQPWGPGSGIEERLDHPVVQISYRDATAFCEWAGKRLPTEAEWEYAARGGLTGARYPWGDQLTPEGEHRCNVWQGEFPVENTAEDGYANTAPVDAFEPNGHGVFNPAGNVWEWCADWFDPEYHTTAAYDPDNPTGPDDGDEKVMRGGSYLCHRSYCNRYRVAARSSNTPDSATGNIGFRCVMDA
jgi:formylglycine-generating enzyme required for sulfatase activity